MKGKGKIKFHSVKEKGDNREVVQWQQDDNHCYLSARPKGHNITLCSSTGGGGVFYFGL